MSSTLDPWRRARARKSPKALRRPAAPAGPTTRRPGEQLRALREQLAQTPVADIVANHAIGLWELAVLHLSAEEGAEPDLEEAGSAIDGVAALVEGLEGRLGPSPGAAARSVGATASRVRRDQPARRVG